VTPLRAAAVVVAAFVATLFVAAPAPAGITIVESGATNTVEDAQGTATAQCPGGSEIAGGGAYTTGAYAATAINTSQPISETAWREYTDVYDGGSANHYAYAICDTGKTTLKSESKLIPAGKTRTVKVSCPGSKSVYGGGFSSTGFYGESDTMVSRPSKDGWQAKLHNFRPSAPLVGVSFVVCGSKSSDVVSRTRPLEGTDQASATATCPGDDRVTGGGAAIKSDTATTWISTLYPASRDSWKVYAENGTGTDYKLTSYAICR
jgi:hypothetical protein